MKVVRIEDWKHFRDLIDKNHPSSALGIDILYRGQIKEEWNLSPSLRRLLKDGVTEGEAIELETFVLRWFQARAAVHLDPSISVHMSQVALGSWWTIMQHYGAPTRLLDWTQSPYVAAYFAVRDLGGGDGAVWIVDAAVANRLVEESHSEEGSGKDIDAIVAATDVRELYTYPDRPFEVIFIARNKMFERMIAQQGYFSICRNVLGIHDEEFEKLSTKFGHPLLTKLIIPAEMKTEFLRELKVLNVTASTLFPGLDGLGRSVEEIIRLNQNQER